MNFDRVDKILQDVGKTFFVLQAHIEEWVALRSKEGGGG